MDNDKLAMISMLPGIESAIATLTRERDLIMGALGLNSGKRTYKKKAKVAEPEITVELAAPKKQGRKQVKKVIPGKTDRIGRKLRHNPVTCKICGKKFTSTQGYASHMRQTHKIEKESNA